MYAFYCRWSLIAGRLPGRTANDVKNYWNTHLLKKMVACRHRMELGEGKPANDHIVNGSVNPAKATTTSRNVVVVKPRPRSFSKNAGWQFKEKAASSTEAPKTSLIGETRVKVATPPPPTSVQTEKDTSNIAGMQYWWDHLFLGMESEGPTWSSLAGGLGSPENCVSNPRPGELSNLQHGANDGTDDCNHEGQFGSSFFSID